METIEKYILDPNGFFTDHLNAYTLQRRASPIYLPLSSKAGNLTIWIYYPALNAQTIFKLINYITPFVDDYASELNKLKIIDENSRNYKLIETVENQFNEFNEFKETLLEISKLPYIPNLNDGVLITSSPFYKLFQNTKWKKLSLDCWKSLSKGDFDWSHLAFSIWPDRVKEKSKNDFSMAIAHDLEDICENKPKEKIEKIKKAPKETKKNLKLNLE
jgi:hypothetical protein